MLTSVALGHEKTHCGHYLLKLDFYKYFVNTTSASDGRIETFSGISVNFKLFLCAFTYIHRPIDFV